MIQHIEIWNDQTTILGKSIAKCKSLNLVKQDALSYKIDSNWYIELCCNTILH